MSYPVTARIEHVAGHVLEGEFDEIHQFRVIADTTPITEVARTHGPTGDEVVVLVKRGSDPARVATALEVLGTILSERGDQPWTRR